MVVCPHHTPARISPMTRAIISGKASLMPCSEWLPLKGASARDGHTLLCTPNHRLRVTLQLLAAHLKGISSNDGILAWTSAKSCTSPALCMTAYQTAIHDTRGTPNNDLWKRYSNSMKKQEISRPPAYLSSIPLICITIWTSGYKKNVSFFWK